MRPKFKDVKREVKRETIKLKHAVMPRGKVRHQERKGTIKKAAKLKKSKVTKTTDDEYDDEWVQKTIRFWGERPPEQHHWELLCQYISKLSNGSPKRFCP